MNEFTLKGFKNISRVYAKEYMEHEFCAETGSYKVSKNNWMIETDGCDLKKVLGVDMVDFKRVTSNDIIEMREVLGIEAARQSIIDEFRHVLHFYGIYVN